MCNSAVTSIKYISLNKSIEVFPNPSNDGYIDIRNYTDKKQFQILNTLGQVVMDGTLNSNEKINISMLKSGLYFILIDAKSQSFIIE